MKKYFLLLFLVLSGCNANYPHGGGWSNDSPAAFTSNGERIYFTGTSASGSVIRAGGGEFGPGMHQRMHGGGCASCHGSDREGARLMPRFWLKAPSLTARTLFGDDHENGDGHGDHASYDSETLKRAITDGIDPAGDSLDTAMPRWSMSEADLNDLIAFLQESAHEH